jgi:O-methyltransferase domain
MILNSNRDEMSRIVNGFGLSQGVYVAASLGIADCLIDGPKTCVELAELTGSHPGELRRFLRFLAANGIFREDEEGRINLTPLAELLRTDLVGSMRSEILHMLNHSSWAAWGELLHSVRSGEAAFPKVFGEDAWSYRARYPEAGALFDQMAAVMSKKEAELVLPLFDFSGVDRIIDVGGGNGEFISSILSRYPNLRGVLFDQPHMVAGAEEVLLEADVNDRCSVRPGDFFKEIPGAGDMYLLKGVIHNWNDAAAGAILQNCRKAMPAHARIVVIESVLDPLGSTAGHFKDLHMLVIHNGQERTRDEFRALLESSGFSWGGLVKTSSGISLIEGVPASPAGV